MNKNIKYVRITFPLSKNAKDPNEARVRLAKEWGIDNSAGIFDFSDEDKDVYLTVEYLNKDMHEDWSWLPDHERRVQHVNNDMEKLR